ncbi:hypothetical protein DXE05_24410 [Vibrio parahaemolyticus]|nr:hypothetical protein DXE05_24410 [Vibrio parahaemolyticus]
MSNKTSQNQKPKTITNNQKQVSNESITVGDSYHNVKGSSDQMITQSCATPKRPGLRPTKK